MKKNFKRTLAKVMAVALTVSMVGVGSADADAASKKIKLSSKSISVAKGKTKKVTIKNVKAKKVKKLTVKSANKKIATVKKSGKTAIKVTGKKAGKSTKVTVKVTVKGKKKATKLTLKVKVTKAKKASKSKTTAAPSASATPAASAAASNAPASKAPTASASAAPTASASAAPTASASAAPTAAATATTEPTAEPTYDPELADKVVALTAENATDWSKSGNYGTVIFNKDGTVSYSSQPTAIDEETGKVKAVSVYNNGLSFLLGADVEDKVDVTPYKYVSLRVKTDAEVKVMAWMGSDDVNDFWSKNDTWGNVVSTVENSDGSKTLVYEVSTIFGKKANKAKAIGLTLKSPAADGTDSEPGVAQEATLYSIAFSNKIPEAVKPAEPTATPVIEPTATPVIEPTASASAAPTASASAAPTASASAAPTASASAAPTASAPTTPAEPDSKTVEIKIVAPETVAVEESAEVSVKVVSDTAAVETAVWEVETGNAESGNAEIRVDTEDCTKAIVTGKKAGTVKVSVNVTLANGKTGKKTTTIQVVASDAEEPKDPATPATPVPTTPDITIALKQANILTQGDVKSNDLVVNADDSISYTSTNKYGGGGVLFKTAKKDLSGYSKVVVKVKTESEVEKAVPVVLIFNKYVDGVSGFWDSKYSLFARYGTVDIINGTPDKDGYYTLEFDISGEDVSDVAGLGLKQNNFKAGEVDNANPDFKNKEVTFTIKSITLVAKKTK